MPTRVGARSQTPLDDDAVSLPTSYCRWSQHPWWCNNWYTRLPPGGRAGFYIGLLALLLLFAGAVSKLTIGNADAVRVVHHDKAAHSPAQPG